jgi:hypothetical protein
LSTLDRRVSTTMAVGGTVAEAAAQRLGGERPSRSRAFIAASVAAVGAGVLVYRLLRSRDSVDEPE